MLSPNGNDVMQWGYRLLQFLGHVFQDIDIPTGVNYFLGCLHSEFGVACPSRGKIRGEKRQLSHASSERLQSFLVSRKAIKMITLEPRSHANFHGVRSDVQSTVQYSGGFKLRWEIPWCVFLTRKMVRNYYGPTESEHAARASKSECAWTVLRLTVCTTKVHRESERPSQEHRHHCSKV